MSTETLGPHIDLETQVAAGQTTVSRRDLGIRAMFMAGTFVAYNLAEIAAKLTLLAQLVASLFTLRLNSRLLDVGERLSRYINAAWRFLLFREEVPPWPFERLWYRSRP